MFSALWPIGLLSTGVLRDLATPPRHSLFVNAIAWLIVAAYYAYCTRHSQPSRDTTRWKLSCLAGLVYGLGQLCDRATADNSRLWWTKALLPLFTYSILQLAVETDLHKGAGHTSGSHKIDRTDTIIPRSLLFLAFGIGIITLGDIYISMTATTLGLCSSVLTAVSLWLLQHLLRNHKDEKEVLNSTEGLMQRRRSMSISNRNVENIRFTMRDISLAIGTSCLLASFFFESFRNDGLTYRQAPALYEHWGTQWQSWQPSWRMERDAFSIAFEGARAFLLLRMTHHDGALTVSLLTLGSAVIAKALDVGTWSSSWLALLYTAIMGFVLDESYFASGVANPQSRLRWRQSFTLLASITLAILALSALIQRRKWSYEANVDPVSAFEDPLEASGPVRLANMNTHPIKYLSSRAAKEYETLAKQQSSNLHEATARYRQRYKVAPPPKFDVWYEFARTKNVRLVDEFDTIYQQLLPFWALSPKMIRSRTTEALGHPGNMLMAVFIREGAIVKVEGGQEWQQKATMGLMKDFVQHLPDMDLAFNVHDEPRVILPHDMLADMVRVANTESVPAAARKAEKVNSFSSRPNDMHNGKRITEVKTTRFNVFAHQPTWTHSKISCPPDTPARYFKDGTKDNATAYAVTNLGFIYNQTAFSDICFTPSLRSSYGFFDRPNAYNIIQELFPIFSQSKISSYSDIIYPSPWYWFERVAYDAERDMPWEEKDTKLYWRGSTTGGFSRNGGWKRQHRQHIVRKFNEPENASILSRPAKSPGGKEQQQQEEEDASASSSSWRTTQTSRKQYAPLIDVKFSHVGQCDPGDCDAQREFFEVVEPADQQAAWGYQHLLDVDGNAFSGRFYAFLKSNSLVYKISLFQEWHADWLKPWVHYVPLSLRGEDWLEAVRYFAQEKEGMELAKKIAGESQEFAKASLRNEDFEVWFFRLLLEYGRLIDDDRENIGFSGP